MPNARQMSNAKRDGLPRGSLTRRGKPRLLSLSHLDQRTAAAGRARVLIDELENDLGGHDRLSAAERQLVQRAAVLGAVCADLEARWVSGQAIEFGELMMAANTQRRILATLGLERRARDVSPPPLREYLAMKAQAADSEETAG